MKLQIDCRNYVERFQHLISTAFLSDNYKNCYNLEDASHYYSKSYVGLRNYISHILHNRSRTMVFRFSALSQIILDYGMSGLRLVIGLSVTAVSVKPIY